MAILYDVEDVHIAQTRTRTRIPTPYFCIVQDPESVPVSRSGSVLVTFMVCSHIAKFSPIFYFKISVRYSVNYG